VADQVAELVQKVVFYAFVQEHALGDVEGGVYF
jgi:hypothetical protein